MNKSILYLGLIVLFAMSLVSASDVKVVDPEDLAKHIPAKFGGVDIQGKPKAEVIKLGGMKMSNAQGIYSSDHKVNKLDYICMGSKENPQWMGLMMGIDMEFDTPEKTIKPVEVKGFKALFVLRKDEMAAEINVMIETNYTMIGIELSKVSSLEEAIEICNELPIKEISELELK